MATENERFVKSYPAFIGSAIWRDDGLFKLYHYCLYKASHNSYQWRGRIIHPGEIPMSRRNAAEELAWSRDKLNQKLNELQEIGLIFVETKSYGTLITLTEWSGYQTACGLEIRPQWTGNSTTDDVTRYGNQTTYGLETRPARLPGGTETRPNLDSKEYSQTFLYPSQETEEFQTFWLQYPAERRTHRAEAAALFSQALLQGATIQSITKALQADLASQDWANENGRYIPGITKWLQKEKWRDYLDDSKTEENESWTTW